MGEIKIYLTLIKAAIQSRMEYRASFVMWILTILGFYGAQIAVVAMMVYQFKEIGGWKAGEIAFLYALLVMTQGVVSALLSGVQDFSDLIREGTFDRLLLRPLSPLLQVLTNRFEPGGLANFFMGVVALIFASGMIQFEWNLMNSFFLFIVIIGGAMILAAIRIAVAAVAFFSISNDGLQHLIVFSSRELLLYPVHIYAKPVRIFLTFLFPIAFINFYPAHFFLSKEGSLFHPYFTYLTFPVGAVMLFTSTLFWSWSMKHYTGTGN